MIFASQAPEERGFVTFLSIMVAIVNVSTMLWLVLRLLSECAFEKKESNIVRAVLKSVQRLRKMASWKAAAETKTAVNTGEVDIELTSGSLNPLYGATPEVTNVAAEGCSSNLAQPAAQPVAQPAAQSVAQPVAHSDDGWTRHFDKSSSRYYLYNETTGESTWE